MKKRVIGLVVAILLVVIFGLIPTPEGLDPKGMVSLGIFLGTLVLFICQTFPMSITCLLVMVITPWFGIGSLSQVWLDFGGASFFFLFFTFAIMNGIAGTSLPRRLVGAAIKISKGNSKALVIGILMVATLISAFMTNLGTLYMMLAIVVPFLESIGAKPGQSGIGRCLYLGLPLVCCVGGMITPAGMPGNLIACNAITAAGYEAPTFLRWTVIYAPIGIVSAIIICLALVLLFKPEKLDEAAVQKVLDDTKALGKMQKNEKLVILIYGIVIVCWFASTWLSVLNTAAVAAVAVAIMFMPGVDLLNWKSFAASTNWDILFVVGSVAVAMGCVNTTGALKWVVSSALSGIDSWSSFTVFFVVGIIVCIARACIPTGPAVPAILTPICISLAEVAGVSPVALGMLPVIACSYPLLLTYTEPIYIATMDKGFYKPFDLDKFGIVLNIVLVLFCAWLFPIVF